MLELGSARRVGIAILRKRLRRPPVKSRRQECLRYPECVPIVCTLAPFFAGRLMVRGPAACGGDAGISGEAICCSCAAGRAVIVRVG